MGTQEIIQKQLSENPIILYMKGVPTRPECGFSQKAVTLLNAARVSYAHVDVLKAPFIREKLPSISHWPTFPQLFINGELVGGADIIETLDQEGRLLPMLKAAEAQEPSRLAHSELQNLIQQKYPDAKIIIQGQGCDLTISVISEQFIGLSLIKQHQGVMASLDEHLTSGRLHALTLKTYTPEAFDQTQAKLSASAGLIQIQS